MNNFAHTVQNADIPVMYVGVSIYIHVKYVMGHSVKKINLQDINAHIAVSALMFVRCAIKHSVSRAL
jgi:hypothetical protein